nr:MAG: hypothetical protein [Bacteriophage sp.]
MIIQGFMPAIGYRSEISIILVLFQKRRRKISKKMISLYLAGVVTQGVRFLLPAIVCQTLKIKNEAKKNEYRFLVA